MLVRPGFRLQLTLGVTKQRILWNPSYIKTLNSTELEATSSHFFTDVQRTQEWLNTERLSHTLAVISVLPLLNLHDTVHTVAATMTCTQFLISAALIRLRAYNMYENAVQVSAWTQKELARRGSCDK